MVEDDDDVDDCSRQPWLLRGVRSCGAVDELGGSGRGSSALG